jgi:hypothetical protein
LLVVVDVLGQVMITVISHDQLGVGATRRNVDGGAAGAAIGRTAAMAVIARAATDGFTSSVDGVVIPVCPGCWTSAPGKIPVFPRLNEMRTFFLKAASQFRPGPPPAFGSPAFLTDLAEVRSFSDNRTHVQDSIAKFWASPGGFSNVAASYANEIATREINKFHLDELRATHVLAVMNMAAMDAFIASAASQGYEQA